MWFVASIMSVILLLNRERHAAAMTRWGVHLARALGVGLHVITAKGGADGFTSAEPPESPESSRWQQVEQALSEQHLTANRAVVEESDQGALPVTTREVSHATALQAVLDYVAEEKANLLVLGKQESSRSGEWAELTRDLFESAPCRMLVLRLGNHEGTQCRSVLVPTRDGDHSHAAVSVGHGLVRARGAAMTAAIVEPSIGQDAERLGDVVLKRALKEAKISEDDDRVTAKVLVSNNVADAIAEEAAQGDYDLTLIGGNARGLRRSLFGTIPDKLVAESGGMAIGVIREALPSGMVMKNRFQLWWGRMVPPLDREARLQLFERLQVGSTLSLDFLVLISLSTLIAAMGLIQGSTAVVIGAMLVAPLMTPLLGAGMSLVQGNIPMLRTCALSIAIGFLLAFAIGALTGWLTSYHWELTSELEARMKPGPLDLGVAFVSGIAASYCLARPNLSSALAGVAIAAALVPPIATAGIALTFKGARESGLASLLFATNVVAIILGSAMAFFLVGVRGTRSEKAAVWARRVVFVLLIAFVVLSYVLFKPLFDR